MPSTPQLPANSSDTTFFARLRPTQTLVEYEFPILLLAEDSDSAPGSPRSWLINWRRGGRPAATPSVPAGLSGVETWIALPLSERRKNQLLSESISLREAILLAEVDPYLLEGSDPFHPSRVVHTRAAELAPSLLPTADITAFGNSINPPGPAIEEGAFRLSLHVVPGGDAPPRPSWAVTSAIQECLQRFVSWAARERLYTLHHQARPPLAAIPADDWAGLSLVAASPGTLTLVARATFTDPRKEESVIAALRLLTEVARESVERNDSPGLVALAGDSAAASILALTDLLSSLHLSVAVKWGDGRSEEFAMIGGPLADRTHRRLVTMFETGGSETRRAAAIVVQLTAEQARALRTEVDPAGGGHQSLIHALQAQINDQDQLTLRPDQVERVVRYVQDYGPGGFQDRLRPVYEAIYPYGLSFVGVR